MIIELWMFMVGVGIFVVGIVLQGIVGFIVFGFLCQVGVCDEFCEFDKLMGCIIWVVQNQIESLVLFIFIVLIVQMLDVNIVIFVFGVMIYVMFCVIYMLVYWLGVFFVCMFLFIGGLVGIVMVVLLIFLF